MLAVAVALAHLMGDGDEVAVSYEDLARHARLKSTTTVRKQILALKEGGYIDYDSKASMDNQRSAVNVYRAQEGWPQTKK